MLQGTLTVGSRVAVAEVPAWATLEVAKGGFATGRLLAEGALQPHEQALLSRLQRDDTGSARAVLNAWYLGEEGLAELRRMLQTSSCRSRSPRRARCSWWRGCSTMTRQSAREACSTSWLRSPLSRERERNRGWRSRAQPLPRRWRAEEEAHTPFGLGRAAAQDVRPGCVRVIEV